MSIDESWFDELLRPGSETAPEDLRAQVLELVARQPSPPERRPRRFALGISSVAAAALIIGLVIGLVIVNHRTPTAVDISPADDTIPEVTIPEVTVPPTAAPEVLTTAQSSEPTVAYREGVTWWIPSWVPDDLSFNYAVQESDTLRWVMYGDCPPACERGISVSIDSRMSAVRRGSTSTVIDRDGNGWSISSDGDFSVAMLQTGDFHIEVVGTGLDIDELTRVVESVALLPETALPRPPLVCCSAVRFGGAEPGLVVTRLDIPTDADMQTWELRAHTDGSMIDLSGFEQVDDTFGPGYRVSSEDPLAFGGRPGFFTDPRPPDGTGIIYGVAHPDVATVDIALADGDIVTVTPQDVSGHFTENFFFVSFPYPDDGQQAYIFEAVDSIVARDARGNQIARYSAPDWTSP